MFALFQQAAMAATSEPSAPSGVILDPLFGIPVAWGAVPYDRAPDLVYACDSLGKQPRGYLFLFGSTTRDGVTYALVHGWERVPDGSGVDGAGPFEQDVTATIVVVKAGRCIGTMADGYAWSRSQRDRSIAASYGITDAVVTALLDDGFERTLRAYGGPRPFLKALNENAPATGLGRLDYLARKVESLRKSAGMGGAGAM
ncbi:hypothetical protein KPL74_00365 [Bacillus sp. NP157]|nr:hypothetical protein KPL74_00365 [Bacillus sp. NP157]